MVGTVTVMTPGDYKKWLEQSNSGQSLAQNGERLFASMGCNSCHNGTAAARGPSLAGVYGSRLTLTA
jgi:cytochrome c oxidase subunit 2